MPTILCFEDHKPDGLVWAVRHNGTWRHAREVVVRVDTFTVYEGPNGPQPRAYLECRGEVLVSGNADVLVIG